LSLEVVCDVVAEHVVAAIDCEPIDYDVKFIVGFNGDDDCSLEKLWWWGMHGCRAIT
jgi:hypothetical protein